MFCQLIFNESPPIPAEASCDVIGVQAEIGQVIADLAVAAASILARAEFLLRLQRLSQELNTTLPKGASPAVELAGRMVVRKYGRDRLATVAKLHFKTTTHVLAES